MLYVYLQDFKMCYDAKFGRKRLPESEDSHHRNPDGAACNGGELSKPLNGSASRSTELSIYEQHQRQRQVEESCICYSLVQTVV